jgi:hypothetical protein
MPSSTDHEPLAIQALILERRRALGLARVVNPHTLPRCGDGPPSPWQCNKRLCQPWTGLDDLLLACGRSRSLAFIDFRKDRIRPRQYRVQDRSVRSKKLIFLFHSGPHNHNVDHRDDRSG